VNKAGEHNVRSKFLEGRPSPGLCFSVSASKGNEWIREEKSKGRWLAK